MKYAILILLIISAMVAIFSFKGNRWLSRYALSFADVIAQQSQTKISFGKVHYLFPTTIIFKNVNVLSADGKGPMLQASRVTVGSFNNIVIGDMAIDFPVLKNYLTLHGKKIYAWAKTLPQKNIRLLVPNGRLYPTGLTKGNPITFKIDFSLNQNYLSAHGFWDDKDKFNYKLYGNIRGSGFDLDKLTLENGRSSMDLWGSWHDNNIDWKGFIFYNKFYILDIDGHLKIQEKDIVLERLFFSVDGDDVGIRGHCSKQNLFQCDADITYRRQAQHINAQQPLKNINLHLHAQNSPQGLSFKGWADFDRIYAGWADFNHMHVDFEDLKILIINDNFLKLKIKQMQSLFSIHGNEHKVLLEDLLACIHFADPYQKAIALSSDMYAGHLYGRIFLNTSSLPWQIKGQGKFEEIDMDLLSNNFSSFKQCHGRLSSNFNLQVSTDIKLTGNLALQNGDFRNSDFQEWLAKILQMPSLDHVSNADLSSHFKIIGKSKMLDDLKLNTDDFDFSGFFHIDADDLVSSQGSVRFSKELLSESPIGRKIIGLVRGAWTLPFEFRLSGNLYRMNFQWNKSPLKDKVRQHLFSFFERIIEQRMDAHPYYNVTTPNESVSPG